MRRIGIAIVVVAAAVAGIVVGMRRASSPPSISVPPPANAPAVQPPAPAGEVTIYLARPKANTGSEEWVLVPVTRPLDPSASPAQASIEALLDGPTAEERAAGLLSPLPEGTRLLGVTREGSTVTVNFSRDLQEKFNGGAEWEEVVLGAIVNTLCDVEGTDAVCIRIEGAPVESIGGHLAADQPLRRDDNIVDRGKQ